MIFIGLNFLRLILCSNQQSTLKNSTGALENDMYFSAVWIARVCLVQLAYVFFKFSDPLLIFHLFDLSYPLLKVVY